MFVSVHPHFTCDLDIVITPFRRIKIINNTLEESMSTSDIVYIHYCF